MIADRALVWELLAYGLDAAPELRAQIIAPQDTHALYIWRVQAATLIEQISDELEGRDAHFPEQGCASSSS